MVQMRDITDRKKLERQLQTYREELEVKVRERTREIEETKQYLENLLENANDVIYTLDTSSGSPTSTARSNAWGYRKDDLLGRPYLVVAVAPASRDAVSRTRWISAPSRSMRSKS